ncbi:MAG: EscU/YscU/HrcU family type III secretion system export apparatus switch protein [Clostridia bacterium]|nr:EscU/YscU/HrcU family type III secretion system export apparatus switch protein [Clostridia bacterium]
MTTSNKKGEKKVKEVAALQYTPDSDKAPKLVALGKGEMAEKILEAAKENNVPIYQDAELAHNLNKLDLGDEIPPELYEVVAEILIFVSQLDQSFGEKYAKK